MSHVLMGHDSPAAVCGKRKRKTTSQKKTHEYNDSGSNSYKRKQKSQMLNEFREIYCDSNSCQKKKNSGRKVRNDHYRVLANHGRNARKFKKSKKRKPTSYELDAVEFNVEGVTCSSKTQLDENANIKILEPSTHVQQSTDCQKNARDKILHNSNLSCDFNVKLDSRYMSCENESVCSPSVRASRENKLKPNNHQVSRNPITYRQLFGINYTPHKRFSLGMLSPELFNLTQTLDRQDQVSHVKQGTSQDCTSAVGKQNRIKHKDLSGTLRRENMYTELRSPGEKLSAISRLIDSKGIVKLQTLTDALGLIITTGVDASAKILYYRFWYMEQAGLNVLDDISVNDLILLGTAGELAAHSLSNYALSERQPSLVSNQDQDNFVKSHLEINSVKPFLHKAAVIIRDALQVVTSMHK